MSDFSFNFIQEQQEFIMKLGQYCVNKKAYVETYGCQQNVSDSEKLKGILIKIGYEIVFKASEADLVIFNTCAIRDSAEQKVLGNIGALKLQKRRNPDMLIGICGCMPEQEHVREYILKKCKHIDFVFGTHTMTNLPQILYKVISENQRVFDLTSVQNKIAEEVPVLRESKIKAYVTVMYGCNNFCSYCIVPYTRGRERSRNPEEIIKEITFLVKDGCKDITLLGQNVNSYGKGLDTEITFAKLLRMINEIDGDFKIRFMTSHPKDLTFELIDAVAECSKVSKHIHLPVQSGSDRILKLMNRVYDTERYLSIIDYVRQKIENPVFTSDIIVGFPGETEEDFQDTLELIKKVRYDTLFTFLYSRRKGTPADKMEEQIPDDVKHDRFNRLLEVQNKISREINEEYFGKTVRVLCEGESKNDSTVLCGRTDANKLVNSKADKSLIGSYVEVKITKVNTWSLIGEII